jgi:hypothetical protein
LTRSNVTRNSAAGGWIYTMSSSCPHTKRQPDLTKARRWDGEVKATHDNRFRELEPGDPIGYGEGLPKQAFEKLLRWFGEIFKVPFNGVRVETR